MGFQLLLVLVFFSGPRKYIVAFLQKSFPIAAYGLTRGSKKEGIQNNGGMDCDRPQRFSCFLGSVLPHLPSASTSLSGVWFGSVFISRRISAPVDNCVVVLSSLGILLIAAHLNWFNESKTTNVHPSLNEMNPIPQFLRT